MNKRMLLSLLCVPYAYAAPARVPQPKPDLVNVRSVNPTIRVELRYATENNCVGKKLYECDPTTCYVLRCVAERLDAVQRELQPMGLGLKVWDGLRTMKAQRKLWEMCPDERYVANPKNGGRHTRGTTVDLTLVRLDDGCEVEMPTEFDECSVKAHRDCMDVSPEARRNRQLLEDVMTRHGFEGLPTEWWHFDMRGWQEYPVVEDVCM